MNIARAQEKMLQQWRKLGPNFLPFADAATKDLPLKRLFRLSLFQVTVGMATGLLVGTLNRVMIVELKVSATLVAAMIGIPLLFAPFRALVGFRSDTHRSAFGWRRVPYLWLGTMVQFSGFAIMPFALLLLSGDHQSPMWIGQVGGALAFLLVGIGMQVTQTAGLALATDLATEDTRPRVVAMMYVMLLVGIILGSLAFGYLLQTFTPLRLIQVVQGAGLLTFLLNATALWKQEARQPERAAAQRTNKAPRASFKASWAAFSGHGKTRRFLLAVFLGSAAFNMQDIILEPYGAEVLGLSVSATTLLTAFTAAGALASFMWAAKLLRKGIDPFRLCAFGLMTGVAAFSLIIFSDPLQSSLVFRLGAMLVGLGGGFFAIGTLTAAMSMDNKAEAGLILGAWGAVQATGTGLAIAMGGVLRDGVAYLSHIGVLGDAMSAPATSYSVVYHIEIGLIFLTLVVLGPLVRRVKANNPTPANFGLADFPK